MNTNILEHFYDVIFLLHVKKKIILKCRMAILDDFVIKHQDHMSMKIV
jgi:hypothetical protein